MTLPEEGKMLLRCLGLLTGTSIAIWAQAGVSFFGGAAIPGESVNDIYNRASVASGDTVRSLLREAIRMGYHIGVRTQTALSGRFHFIGGIALVRFPQSRIHVVDPQSRDTVVTLVSVQNLVPISAGIEFALLPEIVRLTVSAQLSYTLLNSSTDMERGELSIPLAIGTQNQHRVGGDVGVGAGVALGPVGIGVEVRYAISNLIGRTGGEQRKGYLSVLAIVRLGL